MLFNPLRVCRFYAFLTLCIGSTGIVFAQDVPTPLSGYSRFDQIESRLKKLDESPYAALKSLGVTSGERNIWCLTIGLDPAIERPSFAVIGNVVPSHVTGREVALKMAEEIVARCEADEGLKKLLNHFNLHFIPSPTPDATEKNFRFPVRAVDGNNTKTDDDRDFEVGEDSPKDLNQDGWITLMRVEKEFGTHRTHPEDSRVLIPVDSKLQEVGGYELYVESVDADHDEQFGEDAGDGVEFNRNFTFNYDYFGKGAGVHQVSEIETRAIADFLFSQPSIGCVLTFSPEDNLFHPWKSGGDQGRIKTKVHPQDQSIQDRLAEEFRKLHGGKDAPISPAGKGSFTEWVYFHYGRWSFASRGWWIPSTPKSEAKKDDSTPTQNEETKKETPQSASSTPLLETAKALSKDDKRGADALNALRWFESKGIPGFVEWKSIEHPDFAGKKVEVGGIKPLWELNASIDDVPALAESHLKFILEIASRWPQIIVNEVKAMNLGGGLYDVRCKIINKGGMPTMPQMAATNGEWYPIQVKLEGSEKGQWIVGSERKTVRRLNELGGEEEVQWLFLLPGSSESDPSFQIHVYAPTIESVHVKVEVEKK